MPTKRWQMSPPLTRGDGVHGVHTLRGFISPQVSRISTFCFAGIDDFDHLFNRDISFQHALMRVLS